MTTTLKCAMEHACTRTVTHIDEQGYGYCRRHGLDRRHSGVRCRQLRPAEVRILQAGEALARYEVTR